jgi:pyruvate dehydrogenase E2 component (dihydrolipoamide acetyltransferase)
VPERQSETAVVISRVVVPKASANIEEITLTAWLKREGDAVRKGEPLVEMTTDKATFELESPRSGIVRRILAAEKSSLPVGFIMALVGGEDDPLPDVGERNKALMEALRQRSGKRSGKRAGTGKRSRQVVRATPAARRLARKHGLDLTAVKAGSDDDVITESAVKDYLSRNGAG